MKATTQLPLIVGLPLIGIPSLATLAPAPHSRRGFFVRGRGHGNPQEFFGKRNFALLIVVYRSPFGIVRESVPLARTLAACPAPGGAFLCERLPCAVQPTVRVGVESAGLLSQPARASPAYEANLGPLRRAFCAPTSDFRHRNQRLGWPLDCVWRAKFAEP